LTAGIYGISDILNDPSYATTLGLILWPIRGKEGSAFQAKSAGVLGSFVGFFRRLFRV
jgi:hypothetical protein